MFLCPSSASLLIMFMTVGRNLVDNEIIPGSCKNVERSYNSENLLEK